MWTFEKPWHSSESIQPFMSNLSKKLYKVTKLYQNYKLRKTRMGLGGPKKSLIVQATDSPLTSDAQAISMFVLALLSGGNIQVCSCFKYEPTYLLNYKHVCDKWINWRFPRVNNKSLYCWICLVSICTWINDSKPPDYFI